MTQMGFYFDQTRCTGCYTCQVACKDWHDLDAGPVSLMRLKVIEGGRFPDLFLAFLVSPCLHCADPGCVAACPEKAVFKRESDGVVVVDPEKCVGQGRCHKPCLKACPWDAPQFGPEEDARMQKCDLCLDRLETGRQPVCVEACPMFALDAAPLPELRARYGEGVEAAGFKYHEKFKPSVLFKAKKRN